MEELLKDEKLADCTVCAGYGLQKTTFRVVKSHLAKLSDFFRKRLYETNDKDFVVKLKFVPPTAFEVILRKAYHLELKLDGKNVIPTLYVCRKLKLEGLKKDCEQYLKELTAQNVLQIWDAAMKYKMCSKVKIDFRKPPKHHDQVLDKYNYRLLFFSFYSFPSVLFDFPLNDGTNHTHTHTHKKQLHIYTHKMYVLEDRILHTIAHQSEDVLHSEGFLDVTFEVMIRLVAAPFFRVKEEDMWLRVEEWMQCYSVPYLRRFRYKEKEQPYSSSDFDFPQDRLAYETNLERIRPYYTDPDHKESDEEEEETNKQPEEPKKKDEKLTVLITNFLERRKKKGLTVPSKGFEPTQKTIDELIDLWDNFFVRIFRYGLMKSQFFLDRVKDRIPNRDVREEVLIYFIESKRKPKLTKIDSRDMTEETGFTLFFFFASKGETDFF
ncbi:hypothetical protein RFI_16368 [Reticulomyxa filosa]|uniref:BTB domain-containing protein n=1 Tax=Reticulomyxa filosa TaxID=46433 RepID=X6N518_RETFI|nr:hypothetical protein RFI_16368 [Reticulomyxa filosa]|eukprot:ETO20844.1 hypothetical protein RFI_16368 [Reticulomyxa filosa]